VFAEFTFRVFNVEGARNRIWAASKQPLPHSSSASWLPAAAATLTLSPLISAFSSADSTVPADIPFVRGMHSSIDLPDSELSSSQPVNLPLRPVAPSQRIGASALAGNSRFLHHPP
jgi:hypothetical protein